MLEAIEKLLVLQDRDRRIVRTQMELTGIAPQRQTLLAKSAGTQAELDAVKLRSKQVESDRKKLELDAEAKKQQIEKYSLQQFQTKKNEEYRALAHEIELCKEVITKLEDQQIELMEQAEVLQKQTAEAAKVAQAAKQVVDETITALADREVNLQKQLAEYQSNRDALAAAVDEGVLAKYQRLFKQRGDNVVVGIEHGVCGGCHMKLPVQTLVSCQAQSAVNTCPHCGRILYFTPDMELAGEA